jgi:hypothetical protein
MIAPSDRADGCVEASSGRTSDGRNRCPRNWRAAGLRPASMLRGSREPVLRWRNLTPILLVLLLASCRPPAAPSDPDVVEVTGTVRFITIEGGFWAVKGDDAITYDPLGGLPAAFQSEGLRVRIEARRRNDLASVHMTGPIVEILTINKVP